MTYENTNYCPFCSSTLKHVSGHEGSNYYYNCRKCGNFGLSRIVIEDNKLADSEKVIGSFLLRHPDSLLPLEKNETPLILYDDFQKFRENYIEPNALELLDNFLFYYCHTGKIGQRFQQNKFDITVAVKALDLGMGEWVVKQANSMGWLNVFDAQKTQSGAFSSTFELSAAGWSVFYEKQKNHSSSKQAFLALQFNNEVLRKVIIPEIKSACALAGFELLAVDDRPKAGLIDDKIRVDIRNSRFVVVDISDQNQGAYFEAGFAEVFDQRDLLPGEDRVVLANFSPQRLRIYVGKDGNIDENFTCG